MRIVSGVGRATVTRLGFMFVLLGGFAVWFAYDGWITYPRKNLDEARRALPEVPDALPVSHPAVTEAAAKALRADGDRLSLDDLRRQWGEPAYLGPASSGEQVACFVGPYGWQRVTLSGQSVARFEEWRAGPKEPSDIAVQKYLAALLGAIALGPLVLLLRQLLHRYELDDDGLVLPGHGRIVYDRMKGIDVADFSGKGIVRLSYVDAQGQDRTVALDEEKIARFDDILVALCNRKGWSVEVEPQEADAGESQ